MQVIEELIHRNGIDQCDNDDPQSVSRWIWGRAAWRATDLRRGRRRAQGSEEEPKKVPDENRRGNQREGEGSEGIPHEPQIEPVRISPEGLVDELVAYARLMRGGFSIREEAILREIIIAGKSPQEFAQDYDIPVGTVWRLVPEVKVKLRRFLGGEGGLILIP